LPKQVIHGSRLWFWNTTARSGPGPSISRPLQISPPELVSSRPAIRLSTVDLPQPEWPISETNSPLAMLRLTSAKAWNRPFLVSKCLLTWVSSTNLSIRILHKKSRVIRASSLTTRRSGSPDALECSAGVVETLGHPDQALFQQQADQANDDDGDQNVFNV